MVGTTAEFRCETFSAADDGNFRNFMQQLMRICVVNLAVLTSENASDCFSFFTENYDLMAATK